MRTYPQTLEFLFSRLPMFTRVGAAAFKKDLTNTLELCRILENPERQFQTIHIAGTNGKGSSSHMLASILQSAGYRVGLYTSPHLKDFRERIRVNGNMISEEEVIRFTEQMETEIERIQPSFFELSVAMAFDHFAREKTEIAVIETGMGGRLDSTNVITPLLSLITNIGWDHMDFLGNSLQEIAGEKAGIIKKGIPVVIGKTQSETTEVFLSRARESGSPISFADHIWKLEPADGPPGLQSFHVKGTDGMITRLSLDLAGSYQAGNLPGVLQACSLLKQMNIRIPDSAILAGLAAVQKNTGLLGRWQTLSSMPLTICDVGHNEDGIREVVKMLNGLSFRQLHFVFGMVKDKDPDKVLKWLPKKARYYFCRADIPRAMDAGDVQARAALFGLDGAVYPSVKSAYQTARKNADMDDLVFVGGSTFVVAEVV